MAADVKTATRPFFAASRKPGCAFYEEDVTFEWHSGLSWQQRQKSSDSMAEAVLAKYSSSGVFRSQILEVSTASRNYELGQSLSALNLLFEDEKSGAVRCLENWFQASKVFEKDGTSYGPYLELLDFKKPNRYLNAFLDKKIAEQYEGDGLFQAIQGDIAGSSLSKFTFCGDDYPIIPRSAFYDFLYGRALSQERNANLASELCEYRVFTDIMFTPGTGKKRKYNTQARSCAIFVSLSNKGALEEALKSFDSFVDLVEYREEPNGSDDGFMLKLFEA